MIRVYPRPFRIMGYLLWLALSVVGFAMFRGYLLLFFTGFLILIPLLTIPCGIYIATRISVSVKVYGKDVRIGDDVNPYIEIENPLWVGVLDASVKVNILNTFFDKNDEAVSLKVSLPVVAKSLSYSKGLRALKGRSQARLPLTVTRLGGYRISIDSVSVQDMAGLIRIHINPDKVLSDKGWVKETEFAVLPPVIKTKPPEPETISSGMTEVSESNRVGNDFSEVTDIREYVPGDRIRDIHWKLSARTDEWMVKLRTQMAGLELVAVLSIDEDEKVTEDILIYTYQELRSWIDGESDISLRVYNTLTYGFDVYVLSSDKSVDEAFKQIVMSYYHTMIPAEPTPEGLDRIVKNLYPYMGGYIRFGMTEDGAIDYTLIEGIRS